MGIFKIFQFLMPLLLMLGQTFDLSALAQPDFKEMVKEKLREFRDAFGKVTITQENAQRFFEVVRLIRKAGGISALYEFLMEADAAGALEGLRDIFPPIKEERWPVDELKDSPK